MNFWRVESLVSINENCLKSKVIGFITFLELKVKRIKLLCKKNSSKLIRNDFYKNRKLVSINENCLKSKVIGFITSYVKPL